MVKIVGRGRSYLCIKRSLGFDSNRSSLRTLAPVIATTDLKSAHEIIHLDGEQGYNGLERGLMVAVVRDVIRTMIQLEWIVDVQVEKSIDEVRKGERRELC